MKASKRSDGKIRKRLFDKRMNAGMTQQEVADKIGISKAYYCMIENCKQDPTEETWCKLETLFGLESGNKNIRKKYSPPKTKAQEQNQESKTLSKDKSIDDKSDKSEEYDDYDDYNNLPIINMSSSYSYRDVI